MDLFLQAPPPPHALFEEFFAAPLSPHQPVFLARFEIVCSTLSEADSRIVSLLASGRPESSLLPPRNAQYSVGGEASLGSAASVNPSLLAMFKRSLRPSPSRPYGPRGCTFRGFLSGSFRVPFSCDVAPVKVSWVLCASRVSLRRTLRYLTLVTSLSKCLAHQASTSTSHTAFVGLKRRHFYLSHLPAYFTDVHKRAMMAAPLVCADSLFLESDISRLLSDSQTSSSLRSQQALVDVASNRSGPWRRRFSPACSPSRSSPSRRRRRESGSPSRSSKRVRFDSPAPSSALKPPNKGFRR